MSLSGNQQKGTAERQVDAMPTEDGFDEIFTHPTNPYLNDHETEQEPLAMFLSQSIPPRNNEKESSTTPLLN